VSVQKKQHIQGGLAGGVHARPVEGSFSAATFDQLLRECGQFDRLQNYCSIYNFQIKSLDALVENLWNGRHYPSAPSKALRALGVRALPVLIPHIARLDVGGDRVRALIAQIHSDNRSADFCALRGPAVFLLQEMLTRIQIDPSRQHDAGRCRVAVEALELLLYAGTKPDDLDQLLRALAILGMTTPRTASVLNRCLLRLASQLDSASQLNQLRSTFEAHVTEQQRRVDTYIRRHRPDFSRGYLRSPPRPQNPDPYYDVRTPLVDRGMVRRIFQTINARLPSAST
jgi:hypothetical protein